MKFMRENFLSSYMPFHAYIPTCYLLLTRRQLQENLTGCSPTEQSVANETLTR